MTLLRALAALAVTWGILAGRPAHARGATVTPGTPGGLILMLKEFGRVSHAEVLEPALALADEQKDLASFGDHESRPGSVTLTESTPAHGTMGGGSARQGDDYGIAW